jgi:hypothetical protein
MSEDNTLMLALEKDPLLAREKEEDPQQDANIGFQDGVAATNVHQKEKSKPAWMDDKEQVKALRPITESMYRAVCVAGDTVGEAAVQFPGRDKLLQIMKNKDKESGEPRGTMFGAWRLAIEHLKSVGIVHSVPNSGTFVSYGKVGNIGSLLQMMRETLNLKKNSKFQGDEDAKAYADYDDNSSTESVIEEEEEGSDDDDDTIHSTSEDELAAEILKDLKFSEAPVPKAAKGSSRRKKKANAATSSGRGGSGSSAKVKVRRNTPHPSAVAYTLPSDFDLKGPWQPADDEEEEAYLTFLEELIVENSNGKTNWTQGRLQKSVAAIFGVLHAAPRGLPRIELRNAARAFVGDTGLLDYTIKVLVNKVLCGFYMKRDTDPLTGKLLYYAEFADPELKDQIQRNLENQPCYSKQMEPMIQPNASLSRRIRNPRKKHTPGVVFRGGDSSDSGDGGGPRSREGKRKVNSPKRFADYESPSYFEHARPAAKKRHTTSTTAATTSIAAQEQEKKEDRLSLAAKKTKQILQNTPLPLPPPLDAGYVYRQQRVNAQQGTSLVASPEVSCKKEVQGFVNGMIRQFQEQSHNIIIPQPSLPSKASYEDMQSVWVQQCLQGQIMNELTGMSQEIKKIGEQLKQVDPLA